MSLTELSLGGVLASKNRLRFTRHSKRTMTSLNDVLAHNSLNDVVALENWYVAYCREVPGANGQGKTVEECKRSLAEAVALILEDRREDMLRGVPSDARRDA